MDDLIKKNDLGHFNATKYKAEWLIDYLGNLHEAYISLFPNSEPEKWIEADIPYLKQVIKDIEPYIKTLCEKNDARRMEKLL